MRKYLNLKAVALSLLGSLILAFGLYNIHGVSGVTEGGVLGMTLLLDHWLGISPAASAVILNALCYAFGWRTLGRHFLVYSAVSTGGFSLFYAIFERFPPLFPSIAQSPWLCAVCGALFVGVGVGLCVRMGGAPTGDDALAMSISKRMKIKLQWVYLISDLTLLVLSLTYIPWQKLIWSLVTVVISGQIIGLFQAVKLPDFLRKRNGA